MRDMPDLPDIDPDAQPAVVIPCFNRYELSVECVRAVRATAPDALLVIVDNGSTDDTPTLDADVMIRNRHNEGYSVGSNQGAVAAAERGCDPLVFLNNDTVPHPGWYAALARALALPRVAASTCRLTYPDGRIQTTGMEVSRTDGDVMWVYLRQRESASGYVPATAGACMAVRTAAFEAAGRFDPGYWNGYEDAELCFWLWANGYRIVYTAAGTVSHVESGSGRERHRAVDHNLERLRQRWAGWSGTPEINAAGFVPPSDGGGPPPTPWHELAGNQQVG